MDTHPFVYTVLWTRLPSLAAPAVILALVSSALPAQSLTGTTGLVTISTAKMPADGALSVGLDLVDAR